MKTHIARIPPIKGIHLFVDWRKGIALQNKANVNLLILVIILYNLKLKNVSPTNTFHPNKNNVYELKDTLVNYVYNNE